MKRIRHSTAAAALAALALTCAGAAASTGATAKSASRAQQVALMHRQEVMAYQAGIGGETLESAYPTGAHLVATIISDQPSLHGIVNDSRIGTRGHIGVGQTTQSEFVAVGHTADGALVRYTTQTVRSG
jgi:hypothetical protein